jgi:hypothetical protein
VTVRALCIAAALFSSSCVTFSFDRDLRETPLTENALDGLEPSKTSLEQCLARLGAPLYVWEYQGDGVAIAYGWQKEKQWNVTLSVPIVHGYSASASYTNEAAKLRGAVLLFDRDFKLEVVRRGFLKSLREELRQRRPAPVDESENGADSDGSATQEKAGPRT